jgi:hypothetical protein
VSGKSFAPILKDSKARVRKSALTELRVDMGKNKAQGYSIKTSRYRLTQWEENGKFEYELYDHKYDKKELRNLAQSGNYKKIKDSLTNVIKHRIAEARIQPDGLGPVNSNQKEWSEPKTVHSMPK